MPSKRARSPSPSDPPASRSRTVRHIHSLEDGSASTGGSASTPKLHSSGIGAVFGYQELFLRILSFLSPTELASIQGVNRYWSRMSTDQQLWKRLYLGRYTHPHHSRLVYKDDPSRPSTPSKLRPIARLPSRAFPPPSPSPSPSASSIADLSTHDKGKGIAVPLAEREVGYGVRNDGVDWKMMLRLGTNWANGNASTQSTITLPPSPSPSAVSLELEDRAAYTTHSEQHIALFPSFIFTSNPLSPLVHVHRADSSTSALGIIPPPPGWSSPSRPDNVTAICADQLVVPVDETSSSRPARLAVFYQSGGFAIVDVRLESSRIAWSRESVNPAKSRPRSIRRRATVFTETSGDPVILAAMHYPILVTCTVAFHVSMYTLSHSPGKITVPRHLSTMHSDVSFHPAALSLFPNDSTFRAALTYCSPLYPSSWTIAVQEFGIDRTDATRGECYNVGRGDEADDGDEIWPRKIRPVVGVKGRAVGVGSDGRWCVLAGEDNQIQLYSLPTPSPSPEPILHSQTLLAHASAVTSISLNAGRCVSGGRDGRILVWELDEEDARESQTGRTVGFVEVKTGGTRWRGASGPEPDELEDEEAMDLHGLPHPASISSAARSLFLPRPPNIIDDRPPVIRQIAFDEEKIVGLVSDNRSASTSTAARGGVESLKVWNFNG